MESVETSGPPAIEVDAAKAMRAARALFAADLNQIFRRLRHFESEEQWLAALRDGVAQYASEFAIFTVGEGTLRMRSQQNMGLAESLEFPVASVPAFAAAIDSREPLVALRTASEVGSALRKGDTAARAHLFPIANASRVVAVLFGAGIDDAAASALELIAGFAATAFDRQTGQTPHLQIGAAPLRAPGKQNGGMALPHWARLEPKQRAQHSKALRFARVTVAGMQIARPEAARAGREQKNVYMFLRSEIDRARDSYRTQFLTGPGMADYLHLELVQTLASGDEEKLGAEYPGQLV